MAFAVVSAVIWALGSMTLDHYGIDFWGVHMLWLVPSMAIGFWVELNR